MPPALPFLLEVAGELALGDPVEPGGGLGIRPSVEAPTAEERLSEALRGEVDAGLMIGGTANLAGALDFSGSLRPVLEALEEQVVVLRLIGEVDAGLRVAGPPSQIPE